MYPIVVRKGELDPRSFGDLADSLGVLEAEYGDVRVVGPNSVGLARRGFPGPTVALLKKAARILYHDGLNRSQALARIETELEQTEEIRYLVSFYRRSERGVI